jgi:hypothetical protein
MNYSQTETTQRKNKMSNNRAQDQAKMQAESIIAMVAALNVEYDRLEELKDEKESLFADAESACDERPGGWSNDQEMLMRAKYFNDNGEEFKDAKETALAAVAEWMQEHGEELAQLIIDAGDCESQDDARERIQEDALDVQYRSGWTSVGQALEATEFSILLCTGGPAVRIMGELDDNKEPTRAWIEFQAWGTSWEMAHNVIEHGTLLEYCQQFYFGE